MSRALHIRMVDRYTARVVPAAPSTAPDRGRFVVAAVILLVLFNTVDLVFTMLAYQHPLFVELNPLADALSPIGRIVFKTSAVMVLAGVFLTFRRHRLVRQACWLLLAVYGTLTVLWLAWFPFLLSPHYLHKLIADLAG